MGKVLYTGLDPSRYRGEGEVVSFPLIETLPLPLEAVASYLQLPYTTLLFTSRMAVHYYFSYVGLAQRGRVLAIGSATAARLADYGVSEVVCAPYPTGEGVVALLEEREERGILYPHSAEARPLLADYLRQSGRGVSFPLYQTRGRRCELPDLALFERIVLTSPSTVAALHALAPALPPHLRCEAIGPVTYEALRRYFPAAVT